MNKIVLYANLSIKRNNMKEGLEKDQVSAGTGIDMT